MPVTPKSGLYKTFPPSFAEDVKQHVQRRTKCYQQEHTKTESDNIGETTWATPRSNVVRPVSRSRPAMSPLIETTENDISPRSCEPSPRYSSQLPQLSRDSNVRQRRRKKSKNGTQIKETEVRLIASMNCGPSPRVARLPSQPISVSLDNVDLWESDSEQTDDNNKTEKKPDSHVNLLSSRNMDLENTKIVKKMNSVSSEKTLSLSAYDPSKYSDGAFEKEKTFVIERVSFPKAVSPNPQTYCNGLKGNTTPKRPGTGTNRITPPEKSEKTPENHIPSLSRKDETRQTYCLVSPRRERNLLENNYGDVTSSLPLGGRIPTPSTRKSTRIPEDNAKSSSSQKNSKQTSPRIWNSNRAQKSPVPMDASLEEKLLLTAKRQDLRSSNERRKTKSPMLIDSDSNDSTMIPSGGNSKSDLSKTITKSRKTPVPMETELVESHEKHVKFNNLVEVHNDGANSTLDILRNSKSTAKWFKNLYLLPNAPNSPEILIQGQES